jgi:hypothetical protein
MYRCSNSHARGAPPQRGKRCRLVPQAHVLTVRDLHTLALSSEPTAFERQLGPFVLIQKPPDPIFARIAMTLRASSTVPMAHRSRLTDQLATMLQGFEQMWVFDTKNVAAGAELLIGRAEESQFRVDEPSVSKRHAALTFRGPSAPPTLRDLGSTNGTFVNARAIADVETPLGDGDTLCFGDAQFLFMAPRALHAQLLSLAAAPPGAA